MEAQDAFAMIEAGDVDKADRLVIAHAGQIVRQIQEYLARKAEQARAMPLD